MTSPRLAALFACALQAGAARGHGALPADLDRIGRTVQDALVKHGGGVNRCFEKALSDRLDVAGAMEIAVDIGAEGRVARAAVDKDGVGSPILAACLRGDVASWTFPGLDRGTSLIVPFSFQAQAAQVSVKAADAPEHGPPVVKGRRGGGDAPPYSVKVLVDEATMRARRASLSLLTISPASRIAMHRHTGAEILYVLKGHARVLGPPGTPARKLDEGMAAFLAPGMPHALENMGRQTPATLIEVFAPAGPERVYRDPQDPAGRASFQVIHDAKGAQAPPGPAPPLVVAEAAKAAPLEIAAGKGRALILLDPAVTGSQAAALDVLDLWPGAVLPRHEHPGSDEIVYVVSGAGELEVGSETVAFASEQALRVPAAAPHAARFTGPEKTVAIQIYAPAGPEQRFKAPAAPPPGGGR